MRWLLLALILVMFYGGGICCSDEEAKWELEQMMKVSILSKNYVCYSLDLKLCTEYLNYCIDFVFCILYLNVYLKSIGRDLDPDPDPDSVRDINT